MPDHGELRIKSHRVHRMYRLPMTSNQRSKAIGRLKPAVVVNLLLATTKLNFNSKYWSTSTYRGRKIDIMLFEPFKLLEEERKRGAREEKFCVTVKWRTSPNAA
ncbi:uncharacterized protein EAE98_005793 [Botrytis deweyae]|uniref:Uncharacterized protein n=1 Tax=Botrytis deweyae TaxID=2478750 RepID=A0ABQ7IN17_9HELO|nr:uncharacterized protein EAE98_005793 [Botrytis deweyae]KAF7928737.1 hypothetical protein EAE98_005793 [Botrytis deweyae]